ncbi:MAG: hypothetical protein A2855_01660 [Candidatus Liptonbacteria bacterium RIFCSPHIGHO2_01_FULL_57_28]|uniref:HD/PDEase domain-containing protein n=1 Tax=Candidatus Liptonbacteria bacterium RIFCSPHIGHO2_01_FULL_57_28 TaxID=1798647 RepID=A0A1G2C9R5_9BACT|nr:MAG: hypothetical protein A2855_01660 [Candidatus Liptonbacteria bacterium RIFCSPHIGHO2_01_FULL_57_28]
MFPELAVSVATAHELNPAIGVAGHDFDHDLRVAEMAVLIAPDATIARFAAVAGFCHSADRFVQRFRGVGRGEVADEEVADVMHGFCSTTPSWRLRGGVLGIALRAVLLHCRPNDEDDDLVVMTLKDADRIVNCDPDVIVRSSRHHPEYPAVDYVHGLHDPAATYKEPRSILRDISHCLEWAEDGPFGVRLPKAKTEIAWRAQLLQAWIAGVERSRILVSHYYNKEARAF